MRVIAEVLTGSRAYGTEIDANCDHDYIHVYALDYDELLDYQPINILPNITEYELGDFVKELVRGNFSCHQTLWSPENLFRSKLAEFHEIISRRIDLISIQVLENWITMALYCFGRAKRLGAIKLSNKTITDFMIHHFYSNPLTVTSRTLTKCLNDKRLDPNGTINNLLDIKNLGLVDGFLGEDIYMIYEDYAPRIPEFKGLEDESGNLIVHNFPINLKFVYKGIVKYEKRKYLAHKRMMQLLAEQPVKNGYAAKSMYHAFRTIEAVIHYLRYRELKVQVPNPTFMKSIRRNDHTIDFMEGSFKNAVKEATTLLEKYTVKNIVDMDMIKKMVKKIRNSIKEKNESQQVKEKDRHLKTPEELTQDFMNSYGV